MLSEFPINVTDLVILVLLLISGLLALSRGFVKEVLSIAGWVAAAAIAGVVCFIGLYFMQNVFDQKVHAAGPGSEQESMAWSAPSPLETEFDTLMQNRRAN